MKTIGIVACCKTKRASTQAARDLYCSPLFRKSVAYLRRFWCPTDNDWFILSAEHGLVASSQSVCSLNNESGYQAHIDLWSWLDALEETTPCVRR